MSAKTTSTGKPLAHDAAPLHVSGAARYIDDIKLAADTLHLAFGLAPAAHGEITGIDVAAVRAAPGVRGVWNAQDMAALWGHVPDCSPAAHDEPLLAIGEVHYFGQPVFLVAADSHLAARRAARLGRVTLREKPAILTLDDALAAQSRFEGGPVIWQRGTPQDMWDQAPRLIEGCFEVGGQEHFYLEGQVAACIPGEGGDLHVLSSTQHPTEIQHKVAEALNLAMSAVRVEVRRMGGGFGGKESQGNALAIACALVAAHTGRTVKMRYDRDDDMMITGKRHDLRITYRAGFDESGRVLAVDFAHYLRCGWSQDLSLPVADRAMLHADNCYYLPHIRVESHRLRTNTQSATAFRGFGGPQGMIGIERVMEHIAHELGRDPLEVRRANFYRSSAALEAQGGAPQTTHYGMPVNDFIADDLVESLVQRAHYHERRTEIAAFNRAHRFLKRGIALTPIKFGISFTLTHLNQAGALVHIYQDGSVQINHGGTEMGQGLFQKVAQVAADVFGLEAAQIKITATDTAKVPNTSATAASSGSDLNGMAVYNACMSLRARLAAFLAQRYEVTPEDVCFAQATVTVLGDSLPFAQAVRMAYEARISLSSTGFYATPHLEWDRLAGKGRPFLYFAYGAAISEVIIDTLTGENRILRSDIVHDSGSSLNPALDIGQIEGGYVQGAGWLTTEELVWDDQGRLRTHAPSTYKIPACPDRPAIFNVALWENPNPAPTIGRSKAVGEPPFMLGISVFMALGDAVAAYGEGTSLLDAPATPERILMALPERYAGAEGGDV